MCLSSFQVTITTGHIIKSPKSPQHLHHLLPSVAADPTMEVLHCCVCYVLNVLRKEAFWENHVAKDSVEASVVNVNIKLISILKFILHKFILALIQCLNKHLENFAIFKIFIDLNSSTSCWMR